MNLVVMIGRLVADPEIRVANNGSMSIASFRIAVDRRFKRDGQPTADFFSCTAFGKTADFIEKYFHKGSKIAINGELQNDNYEKSDGTKVYNMKIICNDVEFADSKASGGGSQSKTTGDEEFMKVPDNLDSEELPFN